jgi:phosphoglucosamine mutase
LRKLFGTDGIRGVADEYPLDKKTVYAVGRALGDHLPAGPRRVVLGQDTRESSGWMADTLAAGLRDSRVETASAGVVPTPAIAYLTHTHGFSAGVVISASHNPWRDNGIKVFGPDGFKLPDEVELEIETEIFSLLSANAAADPAAPATPSLPGDSVLRRDYLNWLARTVAGAERLRIVVDCANGAATTVAPEIFNRSGAQVEFTHRTPDGRNINENCGALHPEIVAREVVGRTADLGICFDGDADRALFADSNGHVVNGDAVMLLLARELRSRGELANDTVVATAMSNMGLEIALRESGIKMLRAPVGDKYVLEDSLARSHHRRRPAHRNPRSLHRGGQRPLVGAASFRPESFPADHQERPRKRKAPAGAASAGHGGNPECGATAWRQRARERALFRHGISGAGDGGSGNGRDGASFGRPDCSGAGKRDWNGSGVCPLNWYLRAGNGCRRGQ